MLKWNILRRIRWFHQGFLLLFQNEWNGKIDILMQFICLYQSGQIAESGSKTILTNDCQIWQYHP